MTATTTINGHRVYTHEHLDHKVPQHARRFAARLDRAHPAVDRIDYSTREVSVWLDDEQVQASFSIPDGWTVVRTGVYGGGCCLDLRREDA